ncbi:bleomycin resistance family protein [Phytoactinopolyspora alkaliphila]|uniref:Bleomycin resistance protein n=1 Tax=Phytoactinopolyspora alkaliphila TaxID=1783498 RepID=A0A6N9YJE6_9ACTN|nr:glyoxalase superfamily protein [Phytoactinopolyspora alkaliphila]NED95136.1 bleomycin resistance family protein [Phytoactinopolyspora alkaliphila]
MDVTIADAKRAARILRDRLTHSAVDLSHSAALEIVARQLGYRDWNTAVAALDDQQGPGLGHAVPVLRIYDESQARGFYVDYLGFHVEWEHRFEPGLPLYARLRRDELVIDMSEHHGDGTPGSVLWAPIRDLAAFHRELVNRAYANLRPGIDRQAPGGPTMEIVDPFSNVIRFCEATA